MTGSRPKIIVGVLCLGLLVRLALIFWGTPGMTVGKFDDDGDYFRFARTLYTDGIIASESLEKNPQALRAWRGPLFFTFQFLIFKLHGLDNFLAIRLYTAFLSLLIPLAVYFFCSRVWDDTAALIGLVWATFHPPFIHYGAHVQSDAITLIFSTWGLALLMTQRSLRETAASGFIMGVATLGRSQFFLAVGLGFLWMLVHPGLDRKWRRASLLLFMWALTMTPWWIRNIRVFHQFVPFTTEGGFTLWVGLNDWTTGGGEVLRSNVPKELTETQQDKWHYREAFKYLRGHPRRAFDLMLSKEARFWGIVPRVGGWKTKLISFLAYFPLFVLFFWGLWFWRDKFWTLAPLMGICLYYTALHTLFPVVMRYRLPIEPFMIAVAAATLLAGWKRFNQHQQRM